MAPRLMKLRITRAELLSVVSDMIDTSFMPVIEPSTLIETSTVDLFYLVYRHSKLLNSQLDAFLNTSPDFDTKLEFHQRLERLAKFTSRIAKHPPVKEHVELLKTIHGLISMKNLRSETHVAPTITTIKNALHAYLEVIAPIALAATETEATLKKYFLNPARFFTSPDADDYDESFLDSPPFKLHHDYVMSLHTFATTGMTHPGTHPDIFRYLFNPTLYNAQSSMIDRVLFPLVSTIFPSEALRYSRTKSCDFNAIFEGVDLESNSVFEADSRIENPLTNLSNNSDFEKIPTDTFDAGTPFPRGFYDDPDGLPSHPGVPPPRRHGSPPSPTTGPPSPTLPVIPDDTGYIPDVNLARRIRSRTVQVQTQAATDMAHDHMTRFGTTNEGSTSTTNSAVRPGDIRLLGKTIFDQAYLVTYTRMSRKPIFNPITGRRS